MNFNKGEGGSFDSGEPEMNLASLIDVMFLLVIFFAVTTTFKAFPGLSVSLPEAGSEQVDEEDDSIRAMVTEKGKIFLDGKFVEREDLVETLRKRTRVSPLSMFIIEADADARHGLVVEVMDAAKQIGIARLAIATKERADGLSVAGPGDAPPGGAPPSAPPPNP